MLRAEVVATARAMAAEGMVKGTEGNVSARDGDALHITPAGLPYGEMSPDDLVTLDLTGMVVAGEREPSSERAVHLAIYAARPDVLAIVHTHGPAATARSAPATDLPVAEYAEPGTRELAERATRALGQGDAVLMPRHGVVAVGAGLTEALEIARRVEAVSV